MNELQKIKLTAGGKLLDAQDFLGEFLFRDEEVGFLTVEQLDAINTTISNINSALLSLDGLKTK